MEERQDIQAQRQELEVWPKVAIIVLNWNGWRDTIECLESLQRITYPNYQIIVVDNGSTDESVRQLEVWCKKQAMCPPKIQSLACSKEYTHNFYHISSNIIILDLCTNRGYSGGNNEGIKYALSKGFPLIWVLNNDTVVTPDCLEKLVTAARENPHAGIVCPRIHYYENPKSIWYRGGRLRLWLGTVKIIQGYPSVDNVTTITFFASGCAMLVKKEVFEAIGLFDEFFFLRVEDWDFSYRALCAGWQILVCNGAKIYHKVGRSTGRQESPLVWYFDSRNRLYFVLCKTSGILHKIVFVIFFLTGRLVNLIRLPLTGRRKHLVFQLIGICDFFLKKRSFPKEGV